MKTEIEELENKAINKVIETFQWIDVLRYLDCDDQKRIVHLYDKTGVYSKEYMNEIKINP